MKKFLLVAVSSILFSLGAFAQRYAIIDTKYILGKMPEYVDADKKLQTVSDQWQKEIDDKQYMLSDDLKKKREDELYNKEKELRDLQKKRFGYQGDLFKEREKLVKPLQDRVY